MDSRFTNSMPYNDVIIPLRARSHWSCSFCVCTGVGVGEGLKERSVPDAAVPLWRQGKWWEKSRCDSAICMGGTKHQVVAKLRCGGPLWNWGFLEDQDEKLVFGRSRLMSIVSPHSPAPLHLPQCIPPLLKSLPSPNFHCM